MISTLRFVFASFGSLATSSSTPSLVLLFSSFDTFTLSVSSVRSIDSTMSPGLMSSPRLSAGPRFSTSAIFSPGPL